MAVKKKSTKAKKSANKTKNTTTKSKKKATKIALNNVNKIKNNNTKKPTAKKISTKKVTTKNIVKDKNKNKKYDKNSLKDKQAIKKKSKLPINKVVNNNLKDKPKKKYTNKRKIVDKSSVKNNLVIDILKEEEKKTKEKKDLIITREIDISELQDYISKESKIIEDNIDEEANKEDSIEREIIKADSKYKKESSLEPPSKKYSKKEPDIKDDIPKSFGRRKKYIFDILLIFFLLILFVCLIVIGVDTFVDLKSDYPVVKKIVVDKKEIERRQEEERLKKEKEYNECISKHSDESDSSEEIIKYIEDLNSYLSSKYRASVKYVNIQNGFEYTYNGEKVYYAASTIKALDALYIYSKAIDGEVNLDDTVNYTSKYNLSSSYYMSQHKYGEKIKIRDLVKYAVTRSDNRAHQMLIDYIGFANLKRYGQSLGATKTLVGDIFGSINVDDAIIYWQEINRVISMDNELSNELKSYFAEADQNYLSLPEFGKTAIHKYGEYESYYHDIGIVYADSPYIVAILTGEGRRNFEEIIKDINSKIYELNNLYVTNREKVCKELINK